MRNERKRNRYLDIVKGVLILVVVFRHIFQIAADNSDTDYLCNLMAIVEMPLFIAISGYFSLPKLIDCSIEWKPLAKIKKISISYLIPFFSYFIVFRLFFYDRYVDFSSINLWVYNISESLWYVFAIWVLNIFAIMSYTIARKKTNRFIKTIIFIAIYFACLCAYLAMGLVMGINFMGCKLILYYSIYYLLGYLFLNFQSCILGVFENIKEVSVFICTSVYFMGAFKIKVMAVPDTLIFIVLRAVLALAGMVTILYLSYILYKKFECRTIEMIGINTLEIYYVHSFLMNSIIISKAEKLMSLSGLINSFALTIHILGLSTVIIFIIKNNSVISYLLFGKKYKK